ADRGCEGECHRQRNWNGGQHRGQEQGDHLPWWHSMDYGISHEQRNNSDVEQSDIAYKPEHNLLLRAHRVSGANELRSPPELGSRPGRGDLGDSFTSPHQCSGVGLPAWTRFNGHRFAGEHGLVDENGALYKANVRGDDSAQRQLHDVTDHEVCRWDDDPESVSAYRRRKSESRPEGGESRLRAAFLKEAECCVEY